MPRFSIIVPVYNSECYLPKCLDSIFKQSFNDYEVICINDGSTDASLQILKQYRQKFPCLTICSIPNSGPSNARNKGLELATGEYIMFCDSDDWLEGDVVLSNLDLCIKRFGNDADCVYFPGNTNWGGNKTKSPNFKEETYTDGWALLTQYCNFPSYLFFGALYAYCYKREVINKYHLSLCSKISYGEDRLWVFDFLDKAQKSITYSEPCYFYNVRQDSLMTSNETTEKKIRDALSCAELMWERNWLHEKNTEVKRYIAYFYRSSIISAAYYGISVHIKYKKLLFESSKSYKHLFKNIILCVYAPLYKWIFSSKQI